MLIYLYIYVCVCLYVIFKVPTFYDHLHSFPTKKIPKKEKKKTKNQSLSFSIQHSNHPNENSELFIVRINLLNFQYDF